jgi:hypothetical protein
MMIVARQGVVAGEVDAPLLSRDLRKEHGEMSMLLPFFSTLAVILSER